MRIDSNTAADRAQGLELRGPRQPDALSPGGPARRPAEAGPATSGAANVTISGEGQARLAAERAASLSGAKPAAAIDDEARRLVADAQENSQAADSRIRDADFAYETASLARSQIRQQAGVALLAQANTLNQGALRLLG